MKKLLYIDPFSEFGHVNLNKVYVERLAAVGMEVRLVLKDGYAAALGLPASMVELAIPKRYFTPGRGPIRSRLDFWRIFRYIKSHMDFRKYDGIFLSGYEEISLYLSGIREKLYLVNHANVSGLDNPIKRYFTTRISKYSTQLVFADYIKARFGDFGIKDVQVEPLGLSGKYAMENSVKRECLASIDEKLVSGGYDHILFTPTGSKYGSNFVGRLLDNSEFVNYLDMNRILMVIKDKELKSNSENILIRNTALSMEQYHALFLASDLVLIAYPESFNYRVSACLLECLSNGKPCLLSDITSFRNYESHFNYDPFFQSEKSLLDALALILPKGSIARKNPFSNLESLNPTFKNLAKALS